MTKSFLDKMTEQMKKGRSLAQQLPERAMKTAEFALKTEGLKVDVAALKKKKDRYMMLLASKAYELYSRNSLDEPEMLALCREIKSVQWEIDEKIADISVVKEEKLRFESSLNRDLEESVSAEEDEENPCSCGNPEEGGPEEEEPVQDGEKES